MAKRQRPKISTFDASKIEEAIEIGSEIANKQEIKKKSPPKEAKKDPSQRFNIRIPNSLYERLTAASKKTGLSKSAIILGGLHTELSRIEKG